MSKLSKKPGKFGKPLPKKLKDLAKEYGVELYRDVMECENNTGVSISNQIYLGNFDNRGNEVVTFFHELGHIQSRVGHKNYLLSNISSEGNAWECGLRLAAKHGYVWKDKSPELIWAKKQLATYFSEFFLEELGLEFFKWNIPKIKMPRYKLPVLCIVQHWHTKGTRFTVLKRVKESDCTWRITDDNSELSYDWNVIYWMYLPKEPCKGEA